MNTIERGMKPTLNGKDLDDCTRAELRDALYAHYTIQPPRAVVVVATPSGGQSFDVHNDSIFRFAPYNAVHNVRTLPFRATGSNIANNQNELLKGAYKLGATHVLFFENDESIDGNGDAIMRLLQHDKDIVGATYMFKTPGETPLQINVEAMGMELPTTDDAGVTTQKKIDFRSLYTRPELSKVAGLPIGMLMVRMGAFEKIIEMQPDLPMFYHDTTHDKRVRTTDYVFCTNALKAGLDIWLDAPLSLRIKHWGMFPYQFPAAPPEGGFEDFDPDSYNETLAKGAAIPLRETRIAVSK